MVQLLHLLRRYERPSKELLDYMGHFRKRCRISPECEYKERVCEGVMYRDDATVDYRHGTSRTKYDNDGNIEDWKFLTLEEEPGFRER